MSHLSRQSARGGVATGFLLSCLAVTGFSVGDQRSDSPLVPLSDSRPIEVFASPLRQTIDRFTWEHPQVSDAKLAEFANAHLQKVGVNYDFDVGSFIEENHLSPTRAMDAGLGEDESRAIYTFPLKGIDGREWQFLMHVDASGPCGERIVSLPVVKVTPRTFVLVAKGRQFHLQRPPSFALDRMDLVDEAMQTPVHGWEVPYESVPKGVSMDGRSLYVEGFPSHRHELWLAVSDKGISLKSAPGSAQQSAGMRIENHPTDPNNAYLSFMRFHVAGKTMIIRFSGPCT